jgi:hypothetical protein
MRYTCQFERLIEIGNLTLKIMRELCTKAVAQDETGWHRSEEARFERRNGIKGKSTELNSVEQDERGRVRTLDLLIGVRIPASQPN